MYSGFTFCSRLSTMGLMVRKKSSKGSSKSKFWSNLFILGFALILLVGLSFFVSKIIKHEPFCANSISCIKDLSGKFEPNKKDIFMGRVVSPPFYIADNIVQKNVLGDTTGAPKHIFVDLANQRLHAYEGEKLVLDFPISSGKWRPTPTGDFRIWIKIRYAHMEGGEGADYYNLYNVPYTMFFYNSDVSKSMGFSLHGAYWHNNFGHPMSHGCVNIRPEDAGKLYDWADPPTDGTTTYATDANLGTLVTIYGQAPEE